MRKTNADTLGHLLRAMDDAKAVTIRYVKENGEVSRRRIEIHQIEADSNGNILVKCYDHRSASYHTFRLDRVTHYTLHRSARLAAYRMPVVTHREPILDPATDEVCGYRAWDFLYKLAA